MNTQTSPFAAGYALSAEQGGTGLDASEAPANLIMKTDGAGNFALAPIGSVEGIESVSGTDDIDVNNTDPKNPIVSAASTLARTSQLTDFITQMQLAAILEDYATVVDLADAISDLVTESQLDSAISGTLQSIQAGDNITINNDDPRNPLINATGGEGGGFALESVSYATSDFLTPDSEYDNGDAGVGATITVAANQPPFFDPTEAIIGSRIAFLWPTYGVASGIYDITQIGNFATVDWIFTRSEDLNTPDQIKAGLYTTVTYSFATGTNVYIQGVPDEPFVFGVSELKLRATQYPISFVGTPPIVASISSVLPGNIEFSIDPSQPIAISAIEINVDVDSPSIGAVALVAGSAVVNSELITDNTIVLLTRQSSSGTVADIGVISRIAGVSFTIGSLNVLDTSVVGWMLIEPYDV